MSSRLHRQTITLVRRVLMAEPDEYGNDWYADVAREVRTASVQPIDTTEDTDGRDRVQARFRLSLPPGTDIDALDGVLWSGRRFEVEGRPFHRTGLRPSSSYVHAVMREVTG